MGRLSLCVGNLITNRILEAVATFEAIPSESRPDPPDIDSIVKTAATEGLQWFGTPIPHGAADKLLAICTKEFEEEFGEKTTNQLIIAHLLEKKLEARRRYLHGYLEYQLALKASHIMKE